MTLRKRENPYYVAQDILSRRDHSEKEVRIKLKRKGFTSEQIEEAVRWLYDNKLLNDEAYVRRYVESVVATKPVGRRWIVAKLRQRGIPADMAQRAVEEFMSGKREQRLLRQAAESWKRLHPRHKDDFQRLGRFLLSRGFDRERVSDFLGRG